MTSPTLIFLACAGVASIGGAIHTASSGRRPSRRRLSDLVVAGHLTCVRHGFRRRWQGMRRRATAVCRRVATDAGRGPAILMERGIEPKACDGCDRQRCRLSQALPGNRSRVPIGTDAVTGVEIDANLMPGG